MLRAAHTTQQTRCCFAWHRHLSVWFSLLRKNYKPTDMTVYSTNALSDCGRGPAAIFARILLHFRKATVRRPDDSTALHRFSRASWCSHSRRTAGVTSNTSPPAPCT
jgi:hypothetical protein